MLLVAAGRAIADAGLKPKGETLESFVQVSCATDANVVEAATGLKMSEMGDERLLYPNVPGTVAAALGCPVDAVKELVCTGDSGSWPQAMVNRAFEEVANGNVSSVLVMGCEALESFRSAIKQKVDAKELRQRWSEAELDPKARERLESLKSRVGLTLYPQGKDFNEANKFFTENWRRHGLGAPSATYPLMESALMAEAGRSIDEQNALAAEIFAKYSKVAATQHEHAWFGVEYKPEELSTPSADNRPICYPFYNKRLNSVMDVDMSAALVIMSAGEARRRGVAPEKWVFLHGCSEAVDTIDVMERRTLAASPAARYAGRCALEMAGIKDMDKDLDHFDVYSCFPSAVQIVCKELDIPMDRSLTVTGGLPYHGGPGSNYVTHAIAAMTEQLRGSSSQARGLVTANGGYLTKHAFGVYANYPDAQAKAGAWRRDDAQVQAQVDAEPKTPVTEAPAGHAVVENFVVRLSPKGEASLSIVVGRLTEGPDVGKRFVAQSTPGDAAAAKEFMGGGAGVGTRIAVSVDKGGKAVFRTLPQAKL